MGGGQSAIQRRELERRTQVSHEHIFREPPPFRLRLSREPELLSREELDVPDCTESKEQAPEGSMCRFCLGSENEDAGAWRLVSPCGCTGSAKYVHVTCLRQWQRQIEVRVLRSCHGTSSGGPMDNNLSATARRSHASGPSGPRAAPHSLLELSRALQAQASEPR